MFCSSCGGKAIEGAPFCHLCGARVTDSGSLRPATPTTNSCNSKDTRDVAESSGGRRGSSHPACSLLPSGSGPPMMTFTEFKSVKENNRQSHFKTSNKKRKTEDNNASKMVNIKIGIMTYREDHGGLKIVRGGHHGISVSPSCDAKELRVKAVEKHSRFNRKLSDCADLYYLLYPDTIPVEKIPGTEEDFTLQRYKQELGKPFDRITLYLCQTRDYLVNQGYDIVSDGTDSDGDLKTAQGLTDRASASKCNQRNECSDKASTSTCKQGNESNCKSRSQKQELSGLPMQNVTSTGTCYSSYINLISDSEEEDDQDIVCVDKTPNIESDQGNTEVQVSLQEIIAEHVAFIMDDDFDAPKNLLNVRRKHCFKDAINKLSRPGFIPNRRLSVRFADNSGQSEGAVDLGGPTREFLRLAIAEMYETSGMFGGNAKNKGLVLNSQARAMRHYFMCGKLIAVSLCNGGVTGNCLSKSVFKFIVHGEDKEAVSPMIEEIPDHESQIAVGQLQNADSETFPHALELVSTYLENCGYSKPQILPNKDEMVKELCHFLVIDSVRSAIEQFKEGLCTLDLLSMMKKHPSLMEEAFCAKENQLNASEVCKLFLPLLDEPGTNKYSRQELLIMHWRDYLQDSGGLFVCTIVHNY